MAIKIYEKFAPRANPADGDYPYGSIKNESVPGAKDGTPLDAVWANDYAGFDAALFAQAGIAPSGAADTAGVSQRLGAMQKLNGVYGTVASLESGSHPVGAYVRVKDRGLGLFLVQAGGIENGANILNAGGSNTAIFVGDIATPENFGAVGDGVTLDADAIKVWFELPVNKRGTRNAIYNIGTIVGDGSLAATTGVDHNIDFNFCGFKCSGQTDALYTSTAMIKVTNGVIVFKNLLGFDDLTFASRGAGRGVAPWIIINDLQDTTGHVLDNIVVDNCQSLGTFGSDNPDFQATSLKVSGVIRGNCERGITLSNSGSNTSGVIEIRGETRRCMFASNVSGIDLLIYGGNPAPSSGNILLVCDDARTVENIKVRLIAKIIYSASIVAKGAGSKFKNIDFDIWADAAGDVNTEVIRVGAQDDLGNWLSNINYTCRDIKLRMRSLTPQFVEFAIETFSNNIAVIELDAIKNYTFSGGGGVHYLIDNKYHISKVLPNSATAIEIDTNKFQGNVANISFEVFVTGSAADGQQVASKFIVSAFKDSFGNLNSTVINQIYTQSPSTQSVALSTVAGGIRGSFAGFSGAIEATMVVTRLGF